MESFTFIPGHAVEIRNVFPPFILDEICKQWNHYETEKNDGMMKHIWERLLPFIPKTCFNEKLVGYNLDRTMLIKKIQTEKSSRTKETEKEDRVGNVSLATLLIFCTDSETKTTFYSDKHEKVFCAQPEADFYTVNNIMGNVVLFTNKIAYEESKGKTPKTVLKIPIFYTNNNNTNNNSNNNSRNLLKKSLNNFKKTYEVPTPNGEKYNNAQYVDGFGNVRVLTPTNSTDRWNEIFHRPKTLKIQKYPLPTYIDGKMGRAPRDNEDYCPNCFEILSLPVNYTNCSGCLSPILET